MATNDTLDPRPADAAEVSLWRAGPSQLVNLPFYLLCALVVGGLMGGAVLLTGLVGPAAWAVAGAAVLPLAAAFTRWLRTRGQRYELTSQRLLLTHGVLSRRTDEVELYRVKDYAVVEPLGLRLFGLGNLVVSTTDDANPALTLRAVPAVRALRDQLRQRVEACRDRKRVRVSEFE